jgi:ADP-ribosylglycohydrolase
MTRVALWALARGGDAPFLLAAAASLARLTHTDAAAVAGGCLFARAVHHALATGDRSVEVPAAWLHEAERWGGAPPPESVVATVRQRSGGDPELAGALIGSRRGVAVSGAPAAAVRAVERLRATFG